jgi:hypothetical protein
LEDEARISLKDAVVMWEVRGYEGLIDEEVHIGIVSANRRV